MTVPASTPSSTSTSAPTSTSPSAAPDRGARRRALENRATQQAFYGAVAMVWVVGLWFWGILAAVQIGLGILLPRILDPADSSISVSVGPIGAPQVFLFVMGVVTGASMLTIHVAAGGTRRSAWRGWAAGAPVLGVSFALVSLLTTALARLVASLTGASDGAPAVGAFDDAVPVTASLAILGTVAFLAGIGVNAGYRRFGGGLGTLFLPVALAPVVLAHAALLWGASSGTSVPGVGTSPLAWAAALACLAAAPLLAWLLLRRLPIA